jgi:hypothetical protein
LSRFDRGTHAKAGGARTRASSPSRRASDIRRLLAGRNRRSLALLMAAALVAISAVGVAVADIVKGTSDKIIEAGPVSAATGGYPTWYRDSGFTHDGVFYDSIDLEPCLGDKDPMCLPAPAPDGTKPMDVKTGNWPDEFFYYVNEAAGLVSNGGNAVLFESALEGAWSAEVVNDGDQVVFGRIRIRVENLQAGEKYTVVHPQGEDTFVAESAKRGINYTQDVAAAPGNFTSAFKSRVGPFLRWAPNPDDPNDRPPAGYIGDPATDHKVIGSPHGTNYVMITGPQVGAPTGNPAANANPCPVELWDGAVEDCIYTDLFNVAGKESKTGGVDTNRASYSRAADGATVFDVFARSKGSQAMVVRDGLGTGDTRFAATPLVGRQGKYFAHVGVTGTLPESVSVVNTSDDPDSAQDVPLKDLVTVTSAVYDTAAKTLKVTAQSSDKLEENGAPVAKLTLPEFADAPLDATGTVTVPDVPVAPPTVKVASSRGDVGVGSVVATGPASPAISATASGPATAEQGSKVTLSALNSLGQITEFAWTGPDGVTIQDANTATPSFVVPRLAEGANPDLTFTVTVTGPGGTETATVTVKALPITAPKAIIAPMGTVELGMPVTLDGSRSTGAATYLWEQVGEPKVDLDHVDEPTLKFTMPETLPLDANGDPVSLTFRLTVKNINEDEPASSAEITLNSASTDQLTTSGVRFDEDKARWVITGTARLLADNEVTIHAGPTLDGKVIGRSTVVNAGPTAGLGAFSVDVRDSDVTLRDALCNRVGKAYCVSLGSSRGGSLLEVVVDREDRLTQPNQLPPAPVAPAPAQAAADPAPVVTTPGVAATQALPVVGTLQRFAVARVAAPTAITATTVATAGIPVTFTAPAGATLARLRVLTTAGRPLLSTFKKVKAGKKVTVKIRSAKLKRKLRSGKRYVIEVRAGKSKARLGKASRKTIRVR